MKLREVQVGTLRCNYTYIPSLHSKTSTSQRDMSLVFVHGFPGRPQDFRWLIPHLQNFHLYFIALPGQGITPSNSTIQNNISSTSSFVAQCIDVLDIGEFCIVGHSMGGAVASCIASTHPNCKGLICISSIGIRPHKGFRKFGNPKIGYDLISKPKYKNFQWIILPFIQLCFRWAGFPKGIDHETIKTVVEHAYHVSFEEHKNHVEIVGQQQRPIAVIYSKNDPLIEVSIFEEFCALTSPSQIQVFEDGGHNPQKKYAQEMATFIHQWISTSFDV